MYFVFTFCVIVSRYQQIFRETWRIAGGGELAMDQQPTPEGVAIPPNRPILQELCYSTSCSPVLFFRRKRRSCSSPPAFSRRLLRSFRRDWLSFLLWTNITFLFVPVWSSLLYLFVPRVPPLGSGSDYSPFCQRAGVPSADIRYVFDMVCTT